VIRSERHRTEHIGWLRAGMLVPALAPAARTFLAGEQLTIADLSVAGMMTYARVARFPFAALPAIARWYGRIEALDAWRATEVEPSKAA
jgi:glutathione S-transferase